MEFLIRRIDHRDWDYSALKPEVCHPVAAPWRLLSTPTEEPRIEVAGTVFQFISEMPGIHVVVEGGTLDRVQVTSVLTEIVERMGAAEGAPGYLMDLDSYGDAPIEFAGPDEPEEPHPPDGRVGVPFGRGRELLIHCVLAAITLGLAAARIWIGAAVAAAVWLAWGLTVVRVRSRARRHRK